MRSNTRRRTQGCVRCTFQFTTALHCEGTLLGKKKRSHNIQITTPMAAITFPGGAHKRCPEIVVFGMVWLCRNLLISTNPRQVWPEAMASFVGSHALCSLSSSSLCSCVPKLVVLLSILRFGFSHWWLPSKKWFYDRPLLSIGNGMFLFGIGLLLLGSDMCLMGIGMFQV